MIKVNSVSVTKITRLLESQKSSNSISRESGVSVATISRYRNNGIDGMTIKNAFKLTKYADKWISNNSVESKPDYIDETTIVRTETSYQLTVDDKKYTAYLCNDISGTMFVLVVGETVEIFWDKKNKQAAIKQVPSPFDTLSFYYKDPKANTIYRF
ncbi:Trp family transcriptional regulator [Ligilactobacillus equi]|uniref:Trp family transcriptional regulator n=1 Tax=Ligilactobacillus equi TaxID=137357 RepID=UPI000467F857|nr:Trp family transcriptional regulator [Ligilactobacillus equi]